MKVHILSALHSKVQDLTVTNHKSDNGILIYVATKQFQVRQLWFEKPIVLELSYDFGSVLVSVESRMIPKPIDALIRKCTEDETLSFRRDFRKPHVVSVHQLSK